MVHLNVVAWLSLFQAPVQSMIAAVALRVVTLMELSAFHQVPTRLGRSKLVDISHDSRLIVIVEVLRHELAARSLPTAIAVMPVSEGVLLVQRGEVVGCDNLGHWHVRTLLVLDHHRHHLVILCKNLQRTDSLMS